MFSKSIKDYFKNPVIALPYILFTLVIQILTNLFTNPQALSKLESISENSDPVEIFNASGPIFLYMFLLINLGIFLTPVIQAWTFSMSRDAVDGKKPGFSRGFKNSWSYYFRLLSSSIILGLIFIGISFLFLALTMPLVLSLAGGDNMAPVAGIIVLMLLLILVIIVLVVVFLPLPFIIVYDDLDIDRGFRISFKFGFKYFFHILGPLMLLIFMLVVISIPIGISQMISETVSPTLSLVLGLLGTYLWLFMSVYVMNLYREYMGKNKINDPGTGDYQPIIYASKDLPEDTSDSDNKIDQERKENPDNNNFIV